MRIIPIAFCLLLAARPAGAQGATRGAHLPPLLPEDRQVLLARSAAPPHVGSDAAVYVLRAGGYVLLHPGTNGHTCLVEHDHPGSVAPVCYDPEASRTILPGVLRLAELREQGLTYTQAKQQVDEMYAAGRLPAPRRAAMSYMLSRQQVLYSSPTGESIGEWRPHVMIFSPFTTADDVGAGDANDAVPFVADAGKATAHIIVVVPGWSSPAPQTP